MKEMMRDRGYNTYEDRTDHKMNTPMYKFTNSLGDSTLVVWHIDEYNKMGTDTIKSDLIKLQEENVNGIIFIKKGKVTSNAKEILSCLTPYRVQIFDIDEVSINITKHCLVPKHSKCSAQETNELFTQYKIKKHYSLPRIYLSDPIVKYYDWKRGDIIKIKRSTGISYRCVC